MTLVLTSCTNRKRVAAPEVLRAAALEVGTLDSVVQNWSARLKSAEPAGAAGEIYCGRAFGVAQQSARSLGAELRVVSAGLGLVAETARVPSYSLTVVSGKVDNVLERISGTVTPSEWWRALGRAPAFGLSLEDEFRKSRGLILAALSSQYLAMIADELLALPHQVLDRLRFFTLSSDETLPPGLRPYRMPYDARFDGNGSPLPGTRGDFAQRALSHFVSVVVAGNAKGSVERHADAVRSLMMELRPPKPIARAKASDEEIIALIRRHWRAVDGRSGRMLRYLRDDLGVACEQSRFKDLFNTVRDAPA